MQYFLHISYWEHTWHSTQYIQLPDFDRLWPRVDVNEVLTGNILCPLNDLYKIAIFYTSLNNFILLFFILDIIGVLTNVHLVEEITVQERHVLKRTLTVQNVRYIQTINILLYLFKNVLFKANFFTSFIQFCLHIFSDLF